ncbi:hypothetical protein G7046_g266 [Stylonectria norvegica]|nr:hypothetical protein G7046_g266 [Stylonectria norvegica]
MHLLEATALGAPPKGCPTWRRQALSRHVLELQRRPTPPRATEYVDTSIANVTYAQPRRPAFAAIAAMSQSLRPYLQCVRSSLTAALTLSNFASQCAERHNVPEIEAQSAPEVLLTPLTIARNENERVLIEPSINSVRISIKIKQADEIEHILVHKFTRFLTQRAESFFILRRKPIDGYDISFLITNFHTEEMLKHKLVDFIIQFMEEVDKEISEMKLFLNARARFVAESFLTPVVFRSATTNLEDGVVDPNTASRHRQRRSRRTSDFETVSSCYFQGTKVRLRAVSGLDSTPAEFETDYVFDMSSNVQSYPSTAMREEHFPEYSSYQQQQSCQAPFAPQASMYGTTYPAGAVSNNDSSTPYSELNPTSDAWVPSAQEALTNALQAHQLNNGSHGLACANNLSPEANGSGYHTVGGPANGMANEAAPAIQYPLATTNSQIYPQLYAPAAPQNGASNGASQATSQVGAAPFAAYQEYPQATQTGLVNQGHQSVQPNPPMRVGIPHSQSYQSTQVLMSPPPAPQQLPGGQGSEYLSSPEASQSGRLTEPRNYAPRTSGLPVYNEPPPKFNLDVVQYGAQNAPQDIFSPSQGCNSMVSVQAPVVASSGQQGAFPSSESLQNLHAQRSDKLNMLTRTSTGMPTLSMAVDPLNFPFVEGPRQAPQQNRGVIKLKNIPFATRRSEVVAFLGRNSKILNDSEEPVHIIMERATSKTMDAFVEFQTLEDAMKTAEKHHQNLVNGRPSRLGDRPVDVELSSQASLMKDLFPLARGVFWDGAEPKVLPFNAREPWENFKGFISAEEMIMVVKHVEVPHRSPFSKECPQRPYECLISTLRKFPWHMTSYVTIGQRQAIFKATCELIRLLARAVVKEDDHINLNHQLYRRVITSAMGCAGFTPLMKDDIAWTTNMEEMELRAFGQPRFANCWRHQFALAPKPGMPLDVIEYYIALIREQTHRDVGERPHDERTELLEKSHDTNMYWGYYWVDVNLAMGPEFDDMTLAQVAHAEFSAVERILARALPRN